MGGGFKDPLLRKRAEEYIEYWSIIITDRLAESELISA
jgi:hypothetical protein